MINKLAIKLQHNYRFTFYPIVVAFAFWKFTNENHTRRLPRHSVRYQLIQQF